MDHELQTVEAIIDALGGTAATARLTGRKANHVSNWRSTKRFPANTYLIMQQELRSVGKAARPEHWGIKEPAGAA
jgi:hypothetical protein